MCGNTVAVREETVVVDCFSTTASAVDVMGGESDGRPGPDWSFHTGGGVGGGVESYTKRSWVVFHVNAIM